MDWRDGEKYSIEIYEGTEVPYMGVADFTVKPHEAKSLVIQLMQFKPSDDLQTALVGNSLERLVVKIIEGNLLGLKHYIETGEVVTYDVYKRIR